MKNLLSVFIVSLFFGFAAFFLSSAIFLFLLFGMICYIIFCNTSPEDRGFVVTVMAVSFLVKVILAISLHAYFYLKGFNSISGDDLLYTIKSLTLVYKWEGKPYTWARDIVSATPSYGMNPFTYILTIFFKIFGFHPVSAKIINCIIGALIGWLSYVASKNIFDRRSAKICMLIVSFYPSLTRWSVANLKDPLIILLFLAGIYILINAIYNKISIFDISLLMASIGLLCFFVQPLYCILLLIGIILVLFFRFLNSDFIGIKAKYSVGISLFVVITGAISYYLLIMKPSYAINFLYELENRQIMFSRVDTAGYYIYPRVFMECLNKGFIDIFLFLVVVSRAVIYFLFTPFLWNISSIGQALSSPQIILWYGIFLFSIIGFFRLLSEKPYAALFLMIILSVGISVNAIGEGNIGSAFRHRDVFAVFFIILASKFISNFIGKSIPITKETDTCA